MNWLLRKGWITFNSNSKSYRLRSLAKVSAKIDSSSYVGAIIYLENLKAFKGLVYAAIVTNQIKRISWSRRKTMRAGGFSRATSKSRRPSTPTCVYFPMANTYLSKSLKVPVSTISDAKQKAVQAGYIKIKKQFSDLDGIRPGERFLFRKYNEEIGHLAVLNDGKVVLRGPDYIKSDIVLRIVNKLKT